jgi:hypothetical protein
VADEIAAYRTWTALVKDARPVPAELWRRCVPATAADWDKARSSHGPHTQRFIRVYANPYAVDGLARKPPMNPTGAVIVKEKLLAETDATPDGVALMVKRNDPGFRDTGGWEFLFHPADPDPQQTHQACAACHRAASARDYVMGSY